MSRALVTIYVEQPIRTAEEAEALPVGTVVYRDRPGLPETVRVAGVKDVDGFWVVAGYPRPNHYMVGWIALVAREARRQYGHDRVDVEFEQAPTADATRLTTGWEAG